MAIENIHHELVKLLPWFSALGKAFNLEAPPQAILFHGQPGIGKFDFARWLSKALLCEADLFSTGQKPCNSCEACRWFDTGNHPDSIALLPQSLKGRLVQAELEGSPKIDPVTTETPDDGDSKKESAFIKIDEVRAALGGINIGSHRGGKRIILIYPLESLREDASNTLLKSLEEPNPDTIFILVSDRLDRVLPTIRSRCQLIALPKPSRDLALDWLQSELKLLLTDTVRTEELEATIDEHAGSPLSARDQILARHLGDDKDGIGLAINATRVLLEALSKGPQIAYLECAEKVQKAPYSALLMCMQRWLFDLQLSRQLGEVRYYRRHAQLIGQLASQLQLAKAQRLWSALTLARRHENHPLATRVQMESMLLQYQQLFGD
ncbi:MAG: DNA polymerase III subunit delta' [Betaproteobacteria bacterium]|nr:DNA polymerase III subunit delta' [Betaproteobacteria bacterium]